MYLTSKYELSTPCTILEVWSFNVLLDEICVSIKLLQSCPTLCDPMDCSFPGSSVHGILQARILEWVESAWNAGDPGLIPESGRSPGEGIGYHSNILRLPLWLSW